MSEETATLTEGLRKAAVVKMVAALLGSVIYCISRPAPIEGYYGSKIFTTLDGSSGYLHIHRGVIDNVNVGGSGGDSVRRFATYDKLSGAEIHITFNDPQLPSQTISIGRFGFDWSTDLAQGMPDGNHCFRELRPWRIGKLDSFP